MTKQHRLVVAGTDTGVGKTVFSAALAGALDADYWKPVQSGLADGTDRECVAELSGLPAEQIFPEVYKLTEPMSPHLAAEIDGVTVDAVRLVPPQTERPLVIELAGGLLVPLNNDDLQVDVVAGWAAPVVLVARTALGTINHSLLSLEALRARNIPIVGVAFVGDPEPKVEATISRMGQVKRLGRLPFVSPLDQGALARAFADNFDLKDFL
ncbi:MAG: dethiobiotin synthase [Filomicrobium sp.]